MHVSRAVSKKDDHGKMHFSTELKKNCCTHVRTCVAVAFAPRIFYYFASQVHTKNVNNQKLGWRCGWMTDFFILSNKHILLCKQCSTTLKLWSLFLSFSSCICWCVGLKYILLKLLWWKIGRWPRLIMTVQSNGYVQCAFM